MKSTSPLDFYPSANPWEKRARCGKVTEIIIYKNGTLGVRPFISIGGTAIAARDFSLSHAKLGRFVVVTSLNDDGRGI